MPERRGEKMVNVKAEYPEGHKIVYEAPKNIHIKEDTIPKENQKQEKIIWEEEPTVVCPNKEVDIISLTSGVIVKIPVVLAALTVRINIKSLIEFSKPIFQIKEISKKTNINQCTLMQEANVLFIKGYVRKDISFYTGSFSSNNEIYGEVQRVSVDIPFKCTTLVKYNVMKPEEAVKSTVKEFRCNINQDDLDYDTGDKEIVEEIIYEDSSYINQIVTEHYNEAPYCEVIRYEIVETEDIIGHKKSYNNLEQIADIYAIEGKGILNITIRILQKRLVSIPRS